MKKRPIILSALAVAATVSTAMAHAKSVDLAYCLAQARLDPNDPESPLYTVPYNGLASTPCGTAVAIMGRIIPTGALTYYGYLKNTPVGQPCQVVATCIAIRFTNVEI